MTTISAEVILASKHALTGKMLYTLRWRYPRWIHAEGRTHRIMRIGEDEFWEHRTPSPMEDPNLSRNASSSRAIPVTKLIQDVIDDPAIPIFWGANQKGMQAGAECNEMIKFGDVAVTNEKAWLMAMNSAITYARAFNDAGYHKQIVNRLVEPFSHITVIVSATEWDNFFALRDHGDAEPHICLLAQRTKEAMEACEVQVLQPGEWHLPFANTVEDGVGIVEWLGSNFKPIELAPTYKLKLSAARCASTSYKTVEGFDMSPDRAAQLYGKLATSNPIHASPFEHVAQADERTDPSLFWASRPWLGETSGFYRNEQDHRNFRGFRQLRAFVERGEYL
jgi:hypothetical protein